MDNTSENEIFTTQKEVEISNQQIRRLQMPKKIKRETYSIIHPLIAPFALLSRLAISNGYECSKHS